MRTPLRVAVVLLVVLAVGVTALVVRDRPPAAPVTQPAPRPTAPPSRSPLLPEAVAPAPDPAALAAAVTPLFAAREFGPSVVASVLDVETGAVLLDVRGAAPVVPASTAKLATAVAVLTALASDASLTTRVLAGPGPGEVVLVGGGDVTLAGPAAPTGYPTVARLADLATQARTVLAGAPVSTVLVDDTAYAGPPTGPAWRPGYLTGGAVAPVSALSVDGGRRKPTRDEREPDPAIAAGRQLAAALGAPGAAVLRGRAAPGAAQLGAVSSPPVGALVELMLTRSDNDLAESLSRQVALARGQPATFAGAAAAVGAVLSGTGVAGSGGLALVDGSGLSRDDRVHAAALAGLLAYAARDGSGRLAPVLSGLPVAGFDGTLAGRFRAGPTVAAAGQVRAKTGTLEGVSALAGLVRTADGRLLAFDVTADAVPGGAARGAEAALDAVAARLAACGCR